jgi:nitrile hydratase
VQYLSSSYYQIWLAALEDLMVERGLVTRDEIAGGHRRSPGKRLRTTAAADVPATLARGTSARRDAAAAGPARFAVGDSVRMRNLHSSGHTRLPRYVRGRLGRIERVHGVHVFPDRHANCDASAARFDESPQWLYTVSFAGRELWGEDADASLVVSVDAWEPYLESAA